MTKNKNNISPYIGLVGCGYWGKNLIRVFNELGVLRVLCDRDQEVLEAKKKEYPHLLTTTEYKDVLDDTTIRGVVISSPAVTHYELAKQALNANKDVFVEKPLALSVAEGEELVRIAQTRGNILMVGHLLLYHPAVIAFQKMIHGGSLGQMYYITSNRLNFGKVRREENVLWSFAPHDISVVTSVLGTPESVVSVGGGHVYDGNVYDATTSILRFGNNARAFINVSWLHPFKEHKMTIVGSNGMIVFDDQAKELLLYRHTLENTNGSITAAKKEPEPIPFSDEEPLMEEARHFIECIHTRKTPLSNGEEGLRVLKVLMACQQSLEKEGVRTSLSS